VLNIKSDNVYQKSDEQHFIAKKYQLPDIAEIYHANEVIFSSNDVSYKEMIDMMDKTKNKYIDYKISVNNHYIIGSHLVEKILKK
jgi:hypothetical protein